MSSKVNPSAAASGAPASVPERRFLEFQGDGPWTTVTLASVAKISTEKAQDNTCIPMSITSGVGLVSQMEKFGRVIAGESYRNYLLLKKYDFAYNKSATKEYPEGFIAIYTGEELAAVPNSIFTCFRIKGESPSPQYLNYLFLGNLHGRWLRKFIEVGARAHGSLSINDRDLLALPVPVPAGSNSLKEQQKIADCLDSVDALIATQGQKVEALRAHKKGLMQQLFPQEGETQPRLRFPEFRDACEWLPETLENLCSAKISYGIVQAGPHVPGGMPYIKSADLNSTLQLSSLSCTSNEIAKKYRRSEVKPGDIVYSLRGNIGISQIVPQVMAVANLTQGTARIRTKGPSEFYLHVLRSKSVHSRILAVSKGSTFQEISLEALRDVLIYCPDFLEQQRIADCLTSLDDLITAETRKLDTLKTHKKALMQQLFQLRSERMKR